MYLQNIPNLDFKREKYVRDFGRKVLLVMLTLPWSRQLTWARRRHDFLYALHYYQPAIPQNTGLLLWNRHSQADSRSVRVRSHTDAAIFGHVGQAHPLPTTTHSGQVEKASLAGHQKVAHINLRWVQEMGNIGHMIMQMQSFR